MISSFRKFLIVTADDFGLDAAVNEAVERANREGILTATSLMVGAPAAQDAVRRAHRLPRLRVGLHLVLTDGFSILGHEVIPALTGPGGRMNATMLGKSVRLFALPHVRRQFEAEIRAQFIAYSRTGLHLDHVNLHKHFHLHPTLLELVIRIGRDHGMSALRIPDEPHWFAAAQKSGGHRAANVCLKPWVDLLKRRAKRAGVFHNDTLFGVSASGSMDEATLISVIGRLPFGVSEIYLHPAMPQSAALTPSMPAYRHADELAALLSARVRAAIEESCVQTGGFVDAKRFCEAAANL